jgi:vacuolar-type H+-ATPase subunit H
MDIESIVEQVQEIVEDGTRVPGFRGKIMVDSDRILALEEEIRTSVPASIQEADAIISQKESIINQAYLEAQRMKKSAEEEATSIAVAARDEHEAKVEESEIVVSSQTMAEEIQSGAMTEAQQIVHDAQRKAYRLMSEAESSAGSKGEGADQYAREVLFNLEERIAETLGQIRRGIDSLNREEPVHVNGNGHSNGA